MFFFVKTLLFIIEYVNSFSFAIDLKNACLMLIFSQKFIKQKNRIEFIQSLR
jgi:hypothetical protein